MRRGVYSLQDATAPRGDPGPSSSAYRQQQQHQGVSSSPFPTSASRVTSHNASRTLLLPPSISEADQTSLLRLPIGKDTTVEAKSWTYKVSPDQSSGTKAAQAHILALRRLSLAEGRLFAWRTRKRRANRTDTGQDGLFSCHNSTLYSTSTLSKEEARAITETKSGDSAVLGKRKGPEIANEEAQGQESASTSAVGEERSSRLMVRTFILRSESKDSSPENKTAEVEQGAKAVPTPSPLDDTKASPEDDLWGEGGGASPEGGDDAERESALREEVAACRQSLNEVLQRNEKDAATQSGGSTFNLLLLLEPKSGSRESIRFLQTQLDVCFRLALRAKVAEHCVLSRALDLEAQLSKSEKEDASVGSETVRPQQADTTTSKRAEAARVEEDGEIPDAADETMQQPQALPQRPSPPLRRLMAMDGGLLLLPRSAFSQAAESTEASLAIEQEPVIFVRINASRSWGQEDITNAAWNVQLKPEHLECVYALPERGSMVFLAPWGVRALVVETDLGDEAELRGLEGAESLKLLKGQLSERFELETGIEKERLLDDTWITLLEESPANHPPSSHEAVAESREILWPRSLCFPLPRASSNVSQRCSSSWTLGEIGSGQSKIKVCHTPIGDLLRATVKMVDAQNKERSERKVTDDEQHKQTAVGHDRVISTDVLMKEVTPPVSRPDVIVDSIKAGSGFLDDEVGLPDSFAKGEADVAEDNADDNDDDLFGSDGEDAGSPLQSVAGPADLPGLPKDTEHEVDSEKGPQSQFARFGDHQDGLYGMDMITEDDFAFFDEVDDADTAAAADLLAVSDAALIDMGGDSAVVLPDEIEHSDAQPPHAQTETVSAYADGNGIASDPSSMPGFTPSSFTDSSPATGHPMDRTPRTPTSPYYEVGSIVGGAHGRVPPSMYPEIHEAWQGNERSSEASPDFEGAIGQGEIGMDTEHSKMNASAVTLPSHKRLRDLGDKYTSGKFAVPQSFAAAIAGGRRARDAHNRGGAIAVADRNADLQHEIKQQQLEHHLGGLPALHKLRLMSRVDDNSSEAGTIDGTASNMSEDDDDEDDDDLSDLDEEEKEIEALRMSKLQHLTGSMTSSMSRLDRLILRTSLADVPELDAPEPQFHAQIQDDQAFHNLRDEWLTDLIWNPHLLAQLTPETQMRPTSTTLKAMDCRDILDVCSGLSASVAISDPPHHVERIEAPRVLVGCQGSLTEFDATVLRFWDKLGLSGAGGSRDLSILTLHCAAKSEGWRDEAHLWLERLRHAFQSLGLGKCDVMDSVLLGSEDDDLESITALSRELYSRTDLREETLRSLFSRVKGRLGPDQHVVVYALGDGISVPDLINIKSMESDLRAIGREVVGDFANHIHVRYTPWSSAALKGWAPPSRINSSAIQRHAMALYDSLRVCFEHQPVRILHPTLARPKPLMMRLPSFLLVPHGESSRSAVSFALGGVVEVCSSAPMKTRTEATARILFLHAAYDLGSNVGDLACVSVIDESGQGGIMKARRRGSDLRETLRWIWGVVSDYAEEACVRWRIVICKTCTMSARELAAWQDLGESGELRNARCVDYTLASRDVKNPLLVRTSTAQEPLVPSTGGSSSLPAEGRFVDASQASFAIYPTCRVVPSPAPPQDVVELNERFGYRRTRESFTLSTRSSAVVTTFRGPQDCRISVAEPSVRAADRGKGSAEGTHTAWLHIYEVRSGRLFDWLSRSTEVTEFLSEKFFSDHIRQVTRSLFGLRLLAQEPCALDPSGLSPWPFAAIDRMRPVLDKLDFEGPPTDKKAPPPISRMQSYASTSTQTVHKEEVAG